MPFIVFRLRSSLSLCLASTSFCCRCRIGFSLPFFLSLLGENICSCRALLYVFIGCWQRFFEVSNYNAKINMYQLYSAIESIFKTDSLFFVHALVKRFCRHTPTTIRKEKKTKHRICQLPKNLYTTTIVRDACTVCSPISRWEHLHIFST